MKLNSLSGLLILAVGSSPLSAQTLTIDHAAVGCAVAETFPKFDARFSPADSVATARVVFQPEKSEHWWSVAMKPEGNSYVGVLPKPQKSLKAFRYYVEVTGKAMGTARTPEHTAAVVPSSGGCKGIVSSAVSTASILLQGPAGVAGIPAGFASAGVVAGTSTAGAAGASSAAAGGGGLGTGVIIAGVAVVGAGAAVAVGASKGEDSNDGGTGGTGTPSQPTYDVTFTPPATLNLAPCGANTGVTGLAGVLPDTSGNFNSLQTQTTPVMRMIGQVTPTTFQASLSCTNGAVTGSLSATGANDNYSGTFVFGASSGPLTVRKR